MKKTSLLILGVAIFPGNLLAQDIKSKDIPAAVKEALAKRYPNAIKVSWEKEKANYEANWGGKSGEDTSVQFAPSGIFVEEVDAVAVDQLPSAVVAYTKMHYNGAKIKEAGKVTDARGHKMFEAEIKGKDLIFDESGKFIKID